MLPIPYSVANPQHAKMVRTIEIIPRQRKATGSRQINGSGMELKVSQRDVGSEVFLTYEHTEFQVII